MLLLKYCSEHSPVCLLINLHVFLLVLRNVCFASVETAKLFSKIVVPILTPTSSVGVLIVPYLHQILVLSLFPFKHSAENVVIFHSDFNLHTPD